MDRTEIISKIYNGCDEQSRLEKSRHGQLEYLTTMHYIHKFVPAGAKVLEVGAGTGRYSVALAKEGYDVTAIELVEHNLDILRCNARCIENIAVHQGDATDLSAFANNTFDAVLLLGPMYHLYERAEQDSAINEAIRVAKIGGVILAAFLSIHAIMYADYLCGNFTSGAEFNFDSEYHAKHFKEQGFTGFDIDEFEALFTDKPVQKLAIAGTDSVLPIAEGMNCFKMDDADFAKYADYHLKTCEKRELLGAQSHLLYVCRK